MNRIWMRPALLLLLLVAGNVAVIEILRRSPPSASDTLAGVVLSLVVLGFQTWELVAAERRALEASQGEQEWKAKAERFVATAEQHVDVARDAATARRRGLLLDQFSVLTRTWIELNVLILSRQRHGMIRMTAADAAEDATKAREVTHLSVQRGAVATACRGILDQLKGDGADVAPLERLYAGLDRADERTQALTP